MGELPVQTESNNYVNYNWLILTKRIFLPEAAGMQVQMEIKEGTIDLSPTAFGHSGMECSLEKQLL